MAENDFIEDYKDKIIHSKDYIKIDLKDFEYNYNSIIDPQKIRHHHEGELNGIKLKYPFKSFVAFLHNFSYICFNYIYIKKINNNLNIIFSKYDMNVIDAVKLRNSPIIMFYDINFDYFINNSLPHLYKMVINNNKIDDDTHTYRYVINSYRIKQSFKRYRDNKKTNKINKDING